MRLISAAFLALLGVLTAPAATAYVPYVTESGTPLHWLGSTIFYSAASDLPDGLTGPGVQRLLGDSFDAWAGLPCHPFGTHFDGFATGLTADQTDRTNTTVWIRDAASWSSLGFSATELARTGVTHRVNTGEIIDADIQVNLSGFTYSESLVCAPGVYDLQSMLTHEIGHLFGLDHTPNLDATMAPTTDPGVCTKRTLSQDDIDGYCATYEPYNVADPDPEPTADTAGGGDATVAEAEPTAGKPGGSCAGGGSSGGAAALFGLGYVLLAWRRRVRLTVR